MISLAFAYILILFSSVLCSDRTEKDGERKKEVHEFKAETAKLMDIIINSLYSTRDVFLRELISNSADALEKARLKALGNQELLGEESDESKLEIKIWSDPEKREIYIQDTGIGMSKEELINNLGTIAESGTKKFFEEMNEAQKLGEGSAEAAANLIGQFGVGFFSAFLVADFVTVDSVKMRTSLTQEHNEAYRWMSDSQAGFVISKSPEGTTDIIKRGTLITLHIRENDDAQENENNVNYYYDFDSLFEDKTLKDLMEQYSSYIEYPILYKEEVEIEEEVEVCTEEEEEMEQKSTKSEEDEAEQREEIAKKTVEKCHMEKQKKKEMQFKQVNTTKVIWMREPSEITDEEYIKFYKEYLTKGKMTADPAGWVHYKSTIYADTISRESKAKGMRDVSFSVLVFLPRDNALRFRPEKDPLNSGFKLHVNRVFVTDDLKEVIPTYLNFCYGIIDVSDVGNGGVSTINLSREMLQSNKVLELIGKNVSKKVVEKMNELHNEDIEKLRKWKEEEEEEGNKGKSEPEYKFFEMYAKYTDNIKAGVMEDKKNRNKIAKLLRFVSNKSFEIYPDLMEKINQVSYSHGYDKVVRRMRTLDDYIDDKLEEQEFMYYLGCRDVEECKNSPLVEYPLKHGFEVFYLYEPYDTFSMKNIEEYRGIKLVDLMNPRVKFPGAIMTDEERDEDIEDVDNEEMFKQTIKRIRSALSGRLFTVTLSKRLVDSPALVVSRAGTPTANEIRVLDYQFLTESRTLDKREDNRILEINPHNKLIKAIKEAVEKDLDAGEESPKLNELITLLYEAASIESGFISDDATAKLVPKIHQAMAKIDFTAGWDEAAHEVERIKVEKEQEELRKKAEEEAKKLSQEEETHEEVAQESVDDEPSTKDDEEYKKDDDEIIDL